MNIVDTYFTIKKETPPILYKDKGSKFYGFIYPVTNTDDIKEALEKTKKLHPQASHHCYAWQLGIDTITYRANDDGEPNNTAGSPIYGQIQSHNITNVLIIAVRYFGGTKLGVGGLITAYRATAKEAIAAAAVIEKIATSKITITFDYPIMNKVMRIVKKHNLTITKQDLQLNCSYDLAIRLRDIEQISEQFSAILGVKLSTS